MVPDFAPRRALLDRLESSGNQMTYVVAPPGFGKTVLASQWLREGVDREGVGVWIEIDPFEGEAVIRFDIWSGFLR